MNEYALATGKDSRLLESSAIQEYVPEPRVLRPLTEIEQERVAKNRSLVRKHMPELLPEIRELVELGLIDGWRNVTKVEILKKDTA